MAPRTRSCGGSSAARSSSAALYRCGVLAFAALLACAHAAPHHPAHSTSTHHHRRLARSLQQASSTSSTFAPCAVNSPSSGAFWLNATITCRQFWPAPSAPIRVPNDTATVKWGAIVLQTSFPVTAQFQDRNGAIYPISPSVALPQDSQVYLTATPLIVVRATVDAKSGNVTAFTPEVYVPYSTVMATLRGTQFEGKLYNSEPRPVGPNETSWIRWTFSNVVYVEDPQNKYSTLLMGTFDNLFRNVKDSRGKCRPALCDDPSFASPACQYYTQYFGNTTDAMTLSWDPDMHFAADSELVPIFPAFHRQYMASYFQIYDLLKPYRFTPRTYTFIAHGTPMGIPQNFTGVLTKATASIKYC